MPSYQIKQSSTECPLMFLLISSTDHITGLTGATATVTISKAGGAFASPSGAVSEVASGWYKVAANATDSSVVGPLVLHATASGADPCDFLYEVVAFDPQDAVHLGLSSLPNAAAAAAGGLLTFGSSTGQLNPTGGRMPINGPVPKNTLFPGFTFYMALSTDHFTGATGKTITATRNIDGAGFAACANAVTEVGNGEYKLDLAAADLNGSKISFWFASTGCDTTIIDLITTP